jgi:chromosome segregation ATPase
MKNLTEAELKKLLSQRARLELEYEDVKRQRASLSEEINFKHTQIQKLDAEIKKLKVNSNELIVSEHAILRYLERVLDMDLEAIKANIVNEKIQAMVTKLGNGTYPNDGFKLKIVDNVVVTIVTNESEGA